MKALVPSYVGLGAWKFDYWNLSERTEHRLKSNSNLLLQWQA